MPNTKVDRAREIVNSKEFAEAKKYAKKSGKKEEMMY